MVNGQTLAQCTLAVKVGWDSYLQVADAAEELPPGLKLHGINVSIITAKTIGHKKET